MKNLIYLASVAVLCCGFGMAQTSSTDSSQSQTAPGNQQTSRPTPPGDQRDKYGDTVAPDGTVTPKGTNTPGATTNSAQPPSMSNQGSDNRNKPAPPGDRRDRYGDTVAPDGTVTPKGANTPGSAPNGSQPQSSQPQTAAPDAK
jgi:hypothetical protein